MNIDSDRGRILPPNLDDRTWQDLVDEMRALIPVYAPKWTDHNPSDIGITLIELFAWLGESIIYRLNQTPEKSYVAFLDLLGITRDPPTPAYTFLTFSASDGGGTVTVPAGTQGEAVADRDRQPVVFETDEDVVVRPTNLVTAVEVGPYATGAAGATGATYLDVTSGVVGPPTAKHLVAIAPNQTVQLCLGFDAKIAEELVLALRLFRPASPAALSVTWVYSKGALDPPQWPALPGVTDSTASLTQNGTARATPPADWGAQRATRPPGALPGGPQTWVNVAPADANRPVTDPRFWVGARIANASGSPQVVGVERLLFNSARARTALTIRQVEELGVSSGAPFQRFRLAHFPLYQRPNENVPFGGLTVEVGTGSPTVWQAWAAAEDIPAGAGSVFRVDPVPGEVVFGDFDPATGKGRGLVPPRDARIRATRYRYVAAGAEGNVRAEQVSALGTTLAGTLPAGIARVINLGPGLDGADEEAIDDTLRRAPEQLKIRDRAVTADDYEFLAREATNNDIQIVRCLTPRLSGVAPVGFGGIIRAPGQVNLIIVPDQGDAVPRPEPSADQVRQVRDHLEQRRDLTAHLQVLGPRYLPVKVTVGLTLWQQALDAGANVGTVRLDTLDKIQRFLHPTRGGREGAGWQVGQPVLSSDLFRAIMPSPDLGYISLLQLSTDIPAYHFPPINPGGTATNWSPSERPYPINDVGASVRVADYELVCAPLSTAAHTYVAPKVDPQ